MAPVPPLPNPELSQTLVGDYEALHADVFQANALAADFQEHAAGNNSELSVLQTIFEKAQHDLARLNRSIAQLRQERHQLANEAMRAMALDRKLADVTAERDRLRAEGNAMRYGLIASGEESSKLKRETDARIARMALEIDTLRQRGATPTATAAAGGDADIRAALAQISAKLDRLTTQIDGERPASTPVRVRSEAEPAIDIEFDS